jgi:CheY-like chemotaxis protein
MEAIGQLTGGVAHDFNNLLTVILGNLETLVRHLPTTEGRLRNAAEQAMRGAQRAATLTQQLLAFSRRQPLNPKPTDINRLVMGVSDLMRRTLSESIAIETVLGAGLWRVEVDSHQLESALLNLAVNARDAMRDGGKVTIETANAHLDELYAAKFAEITPGQYVAICVSDTGIGMSDEVMSKAFNPFYTTKPIGEGTGLGLSQVYGFVKQSGGHIKLYSEVGEGTTVKIYLPRLIGDKDEVIVDAQPFEPHGKPDETILVVEDDADVRAYSTESLRDLGFTVLEAADAKSALRLLERHPEVQLVFTDVGLPGLNGRELVDRVREARPLMRVLFTTGYARNAIVHHGRLDPGVELLTKPFTRAQLAVRVRTILDSNLSAPLGQKHVLVVEDEELVRMFVVDSLADSGFRVFEAGTADAASRVATEEHLDVAIIDLGLPDRSGMELAKELKARFPNIKIVIASGYGDGMSGSLRDDPGVTFLSKPYLDETLKNALKQLGIEF